MQNSKLTLISTLALALGAAASAQTTTPVTPATTAAPSTTTQVVNFSDIPAGHWARDAVNYIVSKGLIQGYPDGTFRGNQNLTRYEAALIFYRLLQSGALNNGSVDSAGLTTIANGMQEVSTELAALTTRVTDLETLTASQQQRIAALETQIATLNSTGSNEAALSTRLDALEATVRALPTTTSGASAADIASIQSRLTALENRPVGTTAPSSTTVIVPPSTSTTTNTTTAPINPAPTTVVIGDTAPTVTSTTTAGRLYVGANAGYNFNLPTGASDSVQNRLNYGVVVGSTDVFAGFGARVAVDYQPASSGTATNASGNTVSSNANGIIKGTALATYTLNSLGSIAPYVGAGFGLTSSSSRSTSGSNAIDYSVAGVVGVDYRFTDSIGAYAEVQGNYYLSNNGFGTGLQSTSTTDRGGNVTARGGLKFFF